MTKRETVLLAGVSTRAVAAAASRAGHQVIAVEAFGDLDHPAGTQVTALPRDCGVPFSAARAALIASDADASVAAYSAGFENDPAAVARLAKGRQLWGNPPEVLIRVRNPLLFAEALLALHVDGGRRLIARLTWMIVVLCSCTCALHILRSLLWQYCRRAYSSASGPSAVIGVPAHLG